MAGLPDGRAAGMDGRRVGGWVGGWQAARLEAGQMDCGCEGLHG
jgi:hypothetical protein